MQRESRSTVGAELIVGLGLAHLYLTNVIGWAGTPWSGYHYLIGLFVVAVLAAAVVCWRKADGPAPSRGLLVGALVFSLLFFAGLEAYLWGFDLDDKWVYYRMSKNVLTTGLPLWNADERALVGASFIYPYLVSIANLLGDWPVWDLYQKIMGLSFTLALCGVILWKFPLNTSTVLAVVAILLYEPLAQWSLGGLETSFAALWVVSMMVLYLFSDGRSKLFWFMAGALIYIRPDAILLGVGAFAAMFARRPTAAREWLTNGAIFSFPILVFLGQNELLFGYPLPLVFLVKGWNCAYCGHDPILTRMQIGLLHNLSGIAISVLITVFSIAGIWQVLRGIRVRRSLAAPVTNDHPAAFDLYAGLAVYMGYHIVGGYQHMNFTFRYWVPGIIGMLVVSLYVMQHVKPDPARSGQPAFLDRMLRLTSAPVLVALLLLQTAQTALASYQARYLDMALTVAPKRDTLTIDSYANFLRDWFQAGLDLRAMKIPASDKLYLMQGMLTGALTDSYLVDQFYFPPKQTRFPELRRCNTLPEDQHACDIFYEYVITFADSKYWPTTHEPVGKYETIAVLRRRDYPVPATPSNLRIVPVGGDFDLRWQMPGKGEMKYDVEVTAVQDGKPPVTRIEWVQPGARVFRIGAAASGAARLRACNEKGCSDWSAKVGF